MACGCAPWRSSWWLCHRRESRRFSDGPCSRTRRSRAARAAAVRSGGWRELRDRGPGRAEFGARSRAEGLVGHLRPDRDPPGAGVPEHPCRCVLRNSDRPRPTLSYRRPDFDWRLRRGRHRTDELAIHPRPDGRQRHRDDPQQHRGQGPDHQSQRSHAAPRRVRGHSGHILGPLGNPDRVDPPGDPPLAEVLAEAGTVGWPSRASASIRPPLASATSSPHLRTSRRPRANCCGKSADCSVMRALEPSQRLQQRSCSRGSPSSMGWPRTRSPGSRAS